jgi:glycosyltransferase involved in cell wall biosynthesis
MNHGTRIGHQSRHVIVVSYFHPPFPGAGGNRWSAMSHYLRELGYRVTIVACDAWGALPDDPELGVERVRDLRSINLFRRLLRRGELQTSSSSAAFVERSPTALLTRVVPPDLQAVSWVPAAFMRLLQLHRRSPIDCLITTGPPASVHLLGLLLGDRRPAWVADFRDGWRFHDAREPFPTRTQRSLDDYLETRTVSNAHAVTGATEPIALDLRDRLGGNAVCVENGWDPRVVPEPGPTTSALRTHGGTQLVITGNLSGPYGRDPSPLLRALQRLRSDPVGRGIQVVHAGRLTTEEHEQIARSGIGDALIHVGTIPRGEAIALQRDADALLLHTSRNASEATSKIFEYLAAGRPIVALAEGNEAARIVQETGTGITVPPDDVDAITRVLHQAATGELKSAYAPRGLERYTYPAPAEAMAKVIETAIQLRYAA